MELSAEGRKALQRFESCRLMAYRDEAGVWTIGWGHTGGVKEGDSLTQAQADELLTKRVREFERVVLSSVRGAVTQRQFDALICFAYNVGGPAFRGSTLLRKFNAGDLRGCCEQFAEWIHVTKAGKKEISKNLVRRRFGELLMFLSPPWLVR